MATERLLGTTLLDSLCEEARRSSRQRLNLNLHDSPQAPVQRLFNAIEPGSYVVPHRHLATDQVETLLVLRGKLGLLLFDDTGAVTRKIVMAPDKDCFGVHLPGHIWHSVVSLISGSALFEIKAGPYEPLTQAERAQWAPPEGCPEAPAYLAWMCAQFPRED